MRPVTVSLAEKEEGNIRAAAQSNSVGRQTCPSCPTSATHERALRDRCVGGASEKRR